VASADEQKAAWYRRKAEELRIAAEGMTHGAAREALLILSRNYETLAARSEQITAHFAEASRAISDADFSPKGAGMPSRKELILRYQQKASEMRQVAGGVQDAATRGTLLGLARDYDSIVAKLQEREALDEAQSRAEPQAADSPDEKAKPGP
jgi:hypothetical protein